MDIAAALGLAGLMVAQFSLLWYRMGRIEARLESHCREPDRKEKS